ncbi:hypothetical protein JMJ35_004550 [Cladonia borealis]|uniref:AA1-like domain-containing protein n=1 Tax=Cladonia borealis TaxID=184061 RepID=A0AA39V1P9_9LECA|nr:hypothetical protein JMJ35_004550 [Cladonia borealis]
MQALTPLFLLTMALITNTSAMPAASAGALASRQSSGSANLTITTFAVNECSGVPTAVFDLEYDTNSQYQKSAGIVTFYVSRDLTADEQMDFSGYAPAVPGSHIAPYCTKFLQTVSPGYKGEPLTSGPQGTPQCYAGNGAQCVRLWHH